MTDSSPGMTGASLGVQPPSGMTDGSSGMTDADLRHIQGFLATLGDDPPEEPMEAALSRAAVLMSGEVSDVADHLEKKLGDWRGEGAAS